MNLKTGKTAWADGSFAAVPAAAQPATGAAGPEPKPSKPADARCPLEHAGGLDDGAGSSSSLRASADNKDRWLVHARSGHRQDPGDRPRSTTTPGCARRRVRPAPGFGWLPGRPPLWFLSERDGWMHLYTLDAAADGAQPQAAHLRASGRSTSVGLSARPASSST